jgi:hypothetical protein
VARSRETARAYQLERYYITQAFSVLRESGELSEDELASLEFLYLEALEPDVDDEEEGAKSKIPNLERHIEKNPDVFVQAVAFAFKRSDGGEDPPELRPANDEELEHRARSAYTLLQALRRIPGRDRLGKLDAKEIEAWVRKVRASLKELARVDIGDQCIGQLFAKAPKGDDGIWPLLPLRDALENVANEEMARGITTGLYNLRGVVTRGEGGDQEREIAAKYERWERAMEYTHPRVARMMRQMADNYRREADWHDTEADVRKRLRY